MFLHSSRIDGEILIFEAKIAVVDSFLGSGRGRCLGEGPLNRVILLIMCSDRSHACKKSQ